MNGPNIFQMLLVFSGEGAQPSPQKPPMLFNTLRYNGHFLQKPTLNSPSVSLQDWYRPVGMPGFVEIPVVSDVG